MYEPLMNLQRELSDLFDESWPFATSRRTRAFPTVDIAEQGDESIVVAELPGVRKEDLKISIQDGQLTISGERRQHQLPENSSWLKNEAWSGEFSRTIQLPHEVKEDGVSAELKNGILRIVLPKAEEVRAREIKVQ
jgi:HSP20 family protein